MKIKEEQQEKEKYFDGDYRRNPTTNLFCAYCQRDLDKVKYYAYLTFIKVPRIINPKFIKEYNKETEKIIFVPIGSECAKKIGKEWLVLTKRIKIKKKQLNSEGKFFSSQA